MNKNGSVAAKAKKKSMKNPATRVMVVNIKRYSERESDFLSLIFCQMIHDKIIQARGNIPAHRRAVKANSVSNGSAIGPPFEGYWINQLYHIEVDRKLANQNSPIRKSLAMIVIRHMFIPEHTVVAL